MNIGGRGDDEKREEVWREEGKIFLCDVEFLDQIVEKNRNIYGKLLKFK